MSKQGKNLWEWIVEDGDEIYLYPSVSIEGHSVTTEEEGVYRYEAKNGQRLVRNDGFVLVLKESA